MKRGDTLTVVCCKRELCYQRPHGASGAKLRWKISGRSARALCDYPVVTESGERPMKFFVDTADVAEIKELAATGLLDGVTTNPSLVAKAKRDFKEIVAEICAAIPGPVSAEVAATDLEGMLKEGRTLAKIAKNVTVKVPLTWEGLKACRTLAGEGTMVNVTLCFSANQALLAAKAGATFISPFVGRLDDTGAIGMDLIGEIC